MEGRRTEGGGRDEELSSVFPSFLPSLTTTSLLSALFSLLVLLLSSLRILSYFETPTELRRRRTTLLPPNELAAAHPPTCPPALPSTRNEKHDLFLEGQSAHEKCERRRCTISSERHGSTAEHELTLPKTSSLHLFRSDFERPSFLPSAFLEQFPSSSIFDGSLSHLLTLVHSRCFSGIEGETRMEGRRRSHRWSLLCLAFSSLLLSHPTKHILSLRTRPGSWSGSLPLRRSPSPIPLRWRFRIFAGNEESSTPRLLVLSLFLPPPFSTCSLPLSLFNPDSLRPTWELEEWRWMLLS